MMENVTTNELEKRKLSSLDEENQPTTSDLHAEIHNSEFEKYLSEDNLSLRDSDDTTPIESLPPTELHQSDGLTRSESKRIYIDFVHGDPENPLNFSTGKKWFITVIAVTMTFLVSIPAGAYSAVIPDLVSEFGVSREVATLGVSLYPLGCIYILRAYQLTF
jgi:hypothetical protein